MEERIGWLGQNESQIVREEKKNGRLVGAAEISKERAEWCRLQRKNLNTLGLPKRREASVPQREQLARTWEPPLPKGKGTEPSVQSTRSWGGGSQDGREKEGSEQEHGVGRVNCTVNKGRFQGGSGEQARRASLGEVEGSMSG